MSEPTKNSGTLSPPYVSAKTLLVFIARLKASLPTHVDRSLMNGYSGAAISQILLAMRYLKLIGANGDVLENLRVLVGLEGEERAAFLRKLLAVSYPFLDAGFELSTATTATLDAQFRELGVTGDTLRKCAAFLVAMAKESGIPVSPHIKASGRGMGTKAASRRVTKKPKSKVELTAFNASHANSGTQGDDASPVWAKMLVDKLPAFDPGWTDDVKSKWFDAFKQLMELQTK